ncbi:MAG: Rod shape-determining protein MreD [Cyclobacteriaceae bacterium]|jgi:hypothetical protein|nr:Rod shape-determining protein MreD [Cyclobacteriaceae bacterium]
MTRSLIIQIISFFAYLLLQVLLLKNLVLFNVAFCFFYVAFILLLPLETNSLSLLVVSFLMGFLVDVFYDSLGIHTAACVLVAYLRKYWLAAITPQGGYDAGASPAIAASGLQWFIVYALPLLFVHHAALFFIEAAGFGLFWHSMLKIIGSVLFTLTLMVLFQYLSWTNRR